MNSSGSNPTYYEKYAAFPPSSYRPSNQSPPVCVRENSANRIYTGNQEATTEIQAWTTDLCGCSHDLGNCCMTFWCPCITFGRIADEGSTTCGASGVLYALIIACRCCYSRFYRSKMRNQYRLPESPCNDCLVHCCCEECALCQEYRELKHRGFDMTIGWDRNGQRQNGGVAMALSVAVMGERMSRRS